jgi:hypothetical protein
MDAAKEIRREILALAVIFQSTKATPPNSHHAILNCEIE